jgi:aminopeptidase N
VHRIDSDDTVTAAPLQVVDDRTPLPLATAPGALLVPDARDETWARIRFDPATMALLPARLGSVADPVTRGSIWLALRDAFEDAELDPAVALDLVVGALVAEDREIGLRSLATFATVDVVGRALGGDAAARDRVAGALRTRMSSAVPGSGVQLAAARAFVTATGDAAELVAWLGGDAPAGLEMDAEMRWRTLLQAARWGAVDGDRIDAEFALDRTNAGETYAAGCRAARPDPSAKAAAWRLMTQDADVSNAVLYAACENFWWPEQAAVTDAYVERYFAEMPATGAIRQGWVVAEAVGEAYPAYAVQWQTLVQARRLVDDPSVDSSVRRRVADGSDDLRRALAVRERWLG